MIFRSITGRSEIDLLVSRSARQEVSARWVAGLLERGESRLQWCRMALSDGGELLAAHAMDSWSLDRDPGDTPTFVLLLGHVDEAAAVALLNHDLRTSGAATVDARLVLEADSPAELRTLREGQQRVLEASGFTVEVDRVRLHWMKSSGSGPVPPQPPRAGRLTFRPATTLAEGDLVEIFAAVSDGSADHEMITGRAEHGRRAEAAIRLGHARRRKHEDDWFVVGADGADVPAGYVQSALDTDDLAFLAEIGVVESQRGHRYADELAPSDELSCPLSPGLEWPGVPVSADGEKEEGAWVADEVRFAADLYRGAATAYDRYRLPYPTTMTADLARRAQVSGSGRLLDLACGTGQLGFPLRQWFAEVWAVDQEPDMVEAVRAKAATAGARNLRPVVSAAEALAAEPGYFELAVIGNAFHRLDRVLVAARIFGWLQPGGHLALCWSSQPWIGEQGWQRALAAALDKWKAALGAEHRIPAGWEEARSRRPDSEVLSNAGFELAGSQEFVLEHRWTLPELAGLIRSTSFLPATVVGDQATAFDADLVASLAPHSDNGAFTETVNFAYELARKPD